MTSDPTLPNLPAGTLFAPASEAHFSTAPAGPTEPELPIQDRATVPATYWRCGPDDDGFEALIAPRTASRIDQATRWAAPNETMGFLLGRVFRDRLGPYAVVTAVVEASGIEASAGHVQLSTEGLARTRRLAKAMHPDRDILGWWHSHRVESSFSGTDKSEQATWRGEHALGVLVFMTGPSWGRVYRGPTARELDARGTPNSLEPGRASPRRSQQQAWAEAQGLSSQARSPDATGPLRKRRTPASALVAALLGVVVVALAIGVEFRLNRLSSRLQPPPPRLVNVGWSCLGDGQPLEVKCYGARNPNIRGWLWDFGDGNSGTGYAVTHRYESPGRYRIKVSLATPVAGSQAGTIEISLPAVQPSGSISPHPQLIPRRGGGS